MSWQNITLGDVAEGTKTLFQRGRTWLRDIAIEGVVRTKL
jgi:hypothetical protein